MAASEYPVLSALMAPHSAEDFLEHYWPSRATAVHGTLERLPAIFRDPMLASPVALAQQCHGRLRFTHGGSARMVTVADGDPAYLLDMGLTLQFADVAKYLQKAPAFTRQLEHELGLHEGAVNLSAFASPKDDGLTCHYDAAEVISVQLHGSKRWHYAPVSELTHPVGGQYAPGDTPYDELYPQAAHGFPDPETAQFEYATLVPGSVLFLPRGTWHYTAATANSLSISIAVDTPSAIRGLCDQLRALLLQDENWRKPLTAGLGEGPRDAAVRADCAQLLAALPAVIAQLSPDDLLAAPAGVAWRVHRIDPASRFQRAPQARVEIGPAGASGKLSLSFRLGLTPSLSRPAGQVEFPASSLPLLQWIEARTDGPFTAAALQAAFPAIPFATLKDVLSVCVQVQYLRLLWYPALAAVH